MTTPASDAQRTNAFTVTQQTLVVSTKGAGFSNITRELRNVAAQAGVTTGTCCVFIRHTSASLVIQENADPAVLRDLARWMEKIAPVSNVYEHDDEGPDDMPSHLRSAITKTAETIPISGGDLALGTWQGVYVWEHRTRPHRREVVVTIMGV